jgi:hypothetical protein
MLVLAVMVHMLKYAQMGQAPSPAAGRLVFQLKAQGHHEGQDTFEEGVSKLWI